METARAIRAAAGTFLLFLFSHLGELEGHLRGHVLGGDVILLLVEEVLHALLVYFDFHLNGRRSNVRLDTSG